jgi:hypothetical protein
MYNTMNYSSLSLIAVGIRFLISALQYALKCMYLVSSSVPSLVT